MATHRSRARVGLRPAISPGARFTAADDSLKWRNALKRRNKSEQKDLRLLRGRLHRSLG